jgi:ATP-dependent DNA helicase DinG
LGIAQTATCLADSPFQLDRQCLLCIPWEAPRPPEGRLSPATRAERTKAWQVGIANMLVKVVERVRGRTLALFTSNASLSASYDALVRARLPYRILRQGGGVPNAALVDQFRRDTHSVLLGVDSFWQGVDVPGESLSCVVIDKLPYKHGAIDPILDAVEEQVGRDRAFTEYNLPRAIIQFRQAFGRLIRTEQDKGVVVVLDPRVIERNRAQFLGALPGVRLTQDLEDLPCFLDGVEKKAFVLPPPPRVGLR